MTVGLVVVLRSGWLRDRSGRWLADTRWMRVLLPAAALAITVVWLLQAVNSETSITWTYLAHDTAFQFDETAAVINGLTPLVDFNAQYASLFPFALAIPLLAFGKTVLVFTLAACTLSTLVLLAVYGVFRRVTGSSLAALLLYAPFVSMSLFAVGVVIVRFSPALYFPIFPLRYGGPYLLAWLLTRRLERGTAARTWPVLLASGLVMLNNFEFGVPAFAATVAALVWTEPRRFVRLTGQIALGLGGAFLLYSACTLVRAGALPDPLRAAQFARLYGVAGYSVAPIPGVLGLPLVMLLTYVAAFATATTRALDREPNRALTGMLVWSSVFGLGSGSYYVARSDAGLLPMMFSAWALALLLLTVVVVQRLLASGSRRPSIASLATLFAFALAVGSLAQVPTPWTQLQRLKAPPPEVLAQPSDWAKEPTQDPRVRDFVASIADGPHRFVARPSAPVALFATTGHRIADAYDIVDVVPYTGPESIHTAEELDDSLDALRDAGGNTAIVRVRYLELLREGLERHGFAVLTRYGLQRTAPGGGFDDTGLTVVGGYTKWVDLHHLHPAALL
jgi:hypothetical protein